MTSDKFATKSILDLGQDLKTFLFNQLYILGYDNMKDFETFEIPEKLKEEHER